MGEVFELPRIVAGLPPAPPPDLDGALAAARRCFERHGITRTSMSDIGREAKVSRSTIYRQLGSVEQALRLLLAKELHDLLRGPLADILATAVGPGAVVDMLAEVVTQAREHPVLTKVMAHEPEIIGPLLVTELPQTTGQIAELVAPLLHAVMEAGLVRRQDPGALAHWLVRLAAILVVDPPPMPVRDFLAPMLLPALDPTGDPERT